MATITAPFHYDEKNHAATDLVCVIDESGSMAGGRIALVKEVVDFIIDNLSDSDRFGLVGYSSRARTILELTSMNEKNKLAAHELTKKLNGSGATALYDGLKTGIQMMRDRKILNKTATVMLLTDGQANVGLTKANDIISALQGKKLDTIVNRGKNVNKKAGDWNCNKCGYLNFASRNNCKSCVSGKRPGNNVAAKSGDWYCPNCNDLCFARRNKCRKCNTKKPKEKKNIVKKGDWSCPKCNFSNFGSRNKCKKCGKHKEIVKDEEKRDNGNNKKEEEFKLNCTINTFGFGGDHNEKLLEALAEFGNGMYAFIESTNMIADTFSECLGGLLSTIAIDVRLKIEGLNKCQIIKCLSKGYKINEKYKNKEIEMIIGDLQSEETRNILFEISMPKIKNSEPKFNVVRFTLASTNIIKDKRTEIICVLNVNRSQKEEINNSISLSEQENRILVSEWMEKAYILGNENKLEKARQILKNLKITITKSISGKTEFSKNLIKDIDSLINDGMKNDKLFKLKGGKILKMNNKSHMFQRSVQSSNYASQKNYQNYSKVAMKDRFLRGDWKCKECDYKNFSRYSKCNKCGKGLRPRKKGDWDCDSCNTLNFASRSLCYQCGSEKPN